MTLYNYIRRQSQDDKVFSEYNRNSNFILDDFLPDIIPRSARFQFYNSNSNFILDDKVFSEYNRNSRITAAFTYRFCMKWNCK